MVETFGHRDLVGGKRVLALIQARMASTRLPGKVLVPLMGRPMLEHVVDRARSAKTVSEVVVLTSDQPENEAIVGFCNEKGIQCFRGSESDVLDRFYRAAVEYRADLVVRLTGDCPLVDPATIDLVIEELVSDGADYCANNLLFTFPDGLDVEAMTFEALEKAWRRAKRPSEREHVTTFIRYSDNFKIKNVISPMEAPLGVHLSVDSKEDLALVEKLFSPPTSSKLRPSYSDVLNRLREMNLETKARQTIINEGYHRSLVNEAPVAPRENISYEKSMKWLERAERVIPTVSQTFSKGPSQFVRGVTPIFASSGRGGRLVDVDGNEYVDFCLALGPITLGYDYQRVKIAVVDQLQSGSIFSLPHPLTVEVSELMREMIPGCEMVKFGKNGSDVTSAAIRLARAETRRDMVAICGYHGWHDWYIATTTRDRGIPEITKKLSKGFVYNDIDSLLRLFRSHPGEFAAVIMEPIGVEEPKDGFLHKVKELCHQHGALLIFDEIVLGMRISEGGGQKYFGVTPDLSCWGKGIANGYPLSAVMGSERLMKLFNEIFFSTTFGGDAVALAACKATLKEYQEKPVVRTLWELGRQLRDGFSVLARSYGLEDYLRCLGLPFRTMVQFVERDGQDPLVGKSYFQQECFKRGVFFWGAHNTCYSHSPRDVDYTLRVYRSVMELYQDALKKGDMADRLGGPPVQPVFRKL